MSDINGRGVLHVVSELKVTITDNFFRKTIFLKYFFEEVFSKTCPNELFKRKVFKKNIIPNSHMSLSFEFSILNLSFFVSAWLKILIYPTV